MVCYNKIIYIYCSFLILFDTVQSISYLFSSRQTYGYVPPHEPTIRVDSITECVLHCIRQEKCTAVCYNIHDNRCNVPILYLLSPSSQNSGWICYLFEGMYIMCLYIISTAFIYFLFSSYDKENVKIMMVSNSSLYQRNEAFNSKQWSCISGIMVSVLMLSVEDRIDDIISMTTAAM